MLEALTHDQLARTTGAGAIVTDPKACSTANPTGARIYNQSMERDHSGPSLEQRVDAAYDRAMAPWQLMNGLLGGFAAAGTARPLTR